MSHLHVIVMNVACPCKKLLGCQEVSGEVLEVVEKFWEAAHMHQKEAEVFA